MSHLVLAISPMSMPTSDSEYIVVEFNALVLNVNATVTINQGVDNDPASGTAGQSNANNRQNDVTLFVDSSQVGTASPNATVDIAEPAITSITKSVSPATGPYLPGDWLTYTLVFNNDATGNNATTAFDVVLTDTFDANLTLGTVTVTSTQGTSGVDTCAGGTTFTTSNSTVAQLVTVNVTCLDPGNSVTVTVNAAISGAVASGTTIANTSDLTYTSLPGTQGNCSTSPFTCTEVGGSGSGTGERDGSGGSGADGTVLNNYAVTSNTVNTTVTSIIDVSLDKQVSNATPNVGDTVTFTLVIANAGPSTATNIDVTDVIPSGYTYVASSITGGDTNDDTNPATTGLTWTINSLASGASVNLTYQATVLASGTYDNYAEITDHDQTDCDSTPGNASTTEDDDDTQTVTPMAAENPVIGAAKDMSATGTGPWTVTIDYVFENFGNVTLDNLTSSDNLSVVFGTAGVDWSFTSISSVPAAFANPAYNGSTVTELINQAPTQSLGVGGTASISVTITVNTPGSYNNQVTVYGDSPLGTTVNDDSTDGTDPDPNGNNTPDENTPTPLVLDFADLSLTKTVDNSSPSGCLKYHFHNYSDKCEYKHDPRDECSCK